MSENRTVTLSKHEVVLDLDTVDMIWEVAFGADAWEREFPDNEVIKVLQSYGKKLICMTRFWNYLVLNQRRIVNMFKMVMDMSKPTVAFDTKAGETYFEYKRKDGSRFLSIIRWDEWDLDKYHLEFIQRVVWK